MVKRFPPEILSEIFHLSLPVRDPTRATICPKLIIVLTRVCRYWRATAQSTPALWSDLDLPDAPWNSRLRDNLFEALRTWLSYSKNEPLSLRLGSLKHRQHVTKQYLSILCEHASRWKHIVLMLRCNGDPTVIPTIPSNSLPLLERISYGYDYIAVTPGYRENDVVPSAWTLKDALSTSPRLREVVIRHPLACQLFPPSSYITSLTLDLGTMEFPRTVHIGRLLTLLTSCNNLEKLVFCCLDDEDAYIDIKIEGFTTSTVSLPHISTLKLALSFHSGLFSRLLPILDFPDLASFEIQSTRFVHPLGTEFVSFVTRHKDRIKSYISFNDTLCNSYLSPLIGDMTNLSTLAIAVHKAFAYLMFGRLNFEYPETHNGYHYLSNECHGTSHIEHLILTSPLNPFEDVRRDRSYYEAIVGIVEGRWKMPHNAVDFDGVPLKPLKSFRMLAQDKVEMKKTAPEAFKKLMELRDEGFVVGFDDLEDLRRVATR